MRSACSSCSLYSSESNARNARALLLLGITCGKLHTLRHSGGGAYRQTRSSSLRLSPAGQPSTGGLASDSRGACGRNIGRVSGVIEMPGGATGAGGAPCPVTAGGPAGVSDALWAKVDEPPRLRAKTAHPTPATDVRSDQAVPELNAAIVNSIIASMRCIGSPRVVERSSADSLGTL
jgi:hypothetical protein